MNMRPPNGGKRGRSRGRNKGGHHHHGGHHNNINRTLESNGPDVKIRGTAVHIHEKYLALARDAHSSGDRIAAENYLQHAEHYYRIINAEYANRPQNGGHQHGRYPTGPGSAPGAGGDGPEGHFDERQSQPSGSNDPQGSDNRTTDPHRDGHGPGTEPFPT